MKRLFMFSTVLSAFLTGVHAADWEVTPVAGVVFPDKDAHLDSENVFGGELQYNGFEAFFAPELQVLQSLETDFNAYPGNPNDSEPLKNGSTFVNRIALHAVHDFDTKSAFYPFFKVGAGYESFHDYHYFENKDGSYADAGLGVKYFFTDTVALKLEGLAMHRLSKRKDLSYDIDFAALGGITFAFGGQDGRAAEASTEASATEKMVADDDAAHAETERKAAAQAAEESKQAEAAAAAAAAMAAANADDDRDGVRNADDLCMHTPAGMKVDDVGCAVPPKIDLTFARDSADLSEMQKEALKTYADFLVRTGKQVRVIGHSDSSGVERYNKTLSLQRAQAVSDILIQNGVAAQNIETAGRGESEPIMSNKTQEGQAANRRVELYILR